jgi:hypothetical protein
MFIKRFLFVGALALAPAFAQDSDTSIWREAIGHTQIPAQGCFRASYPNLVWEQVACQEAHPQLHPHPVFQNLVGGQVTGNGKDYVAEAAGLISETLGTFPTVTGVTGEKSVGVPAFGDGGILGANEYTLQINTNYTGTTSACAGHSGCTVWQQFIYSTDYETKGQAAVFMQYWLIGWGNSACPGTFASAGGGDCYKNSNYIAAPDQKIATLGKLSLSGAATGGLNDTVVFNNGTAAYSVSGSDSVLDISAVWKESEFNAVGDAGGSRADFNKGASITVKVALTDGSTAAPTCVANAGSTGETNNLNLGSCAVTGGTTPYIQFNESN